jgi:hypothetical protein
MCPFYQADRFTEALHRIQREARFCRTSGEDLETLRNELRQDFDFSSSHGLLSEAASLAAMTDSVIGDGDGGAQ